MVILETQMLTRRFGALTALSLIIACLVKMGECFMGIGRMLTMPLFFASNAIYRYWIPASWWPRRPVWWLSVGGHTPM
jgi:hypothetical protein